jgi:hypothetical protein
VSLSGAIGTADDPTRNETSGINFVIRHLQENDLLKTGPSHLPTALGLRLTFRGWDRLEELRHATDESRVAFMAMKFGDATLDGVYRNHFKDAVKRTGFELRRLDEKQPAGLIDNHMT